MSANAITILAVCFLAAVHGWIAPDVSTVCVEFACNDGFFCRAVQASADAAPTASCVPCVPAGIDNTCRLNGYAKTVFTGEASNWSAFACVEGNCPAGSSCQYDAMNNGVCCYEPAAELPAESWCN